MFAKKFHTVIRKAREDGTLDIRVSEQELFVETLYTVLCVAGKPVNGLFLRPASAPSRTSSGSPTSASSSKGNRELVSSAYPLGALRHTPCLRGCMTVGKT